MVDLISIKPKVVKKPVSFRLRETTAKQLLDLKQRVKSNSNEVQFNLDEVIDEQLVKLIERANKQLDSLVQHT